MLKYGADVNLKDSTGNTPLHLGSRAGGSFEQDIFAKLLDSGADVTIANTNGDTPFHLAVLHQNYPAVVKIMNVKVCHIHT